MVPVWVGFLERPWRPRYAMETLAQMRHQRQTVPRASRRLPRAGLARGTRWSRQTSALRYRLQNLYVYAEWIAKRGPLRAGMQRAREIMWALARPDVGRMLCDDLGWTQAQHTDWLADALTLTLLPENSCRNRSR
jgi:hypothetical protein